ncbi:hypothetical protein L3V77_20980 [Vibrio sp. DW001]|uniref:hypothetical protein n=1 Tax=Vibrio sp. DW001 TaxID=2912315 RepID=UPI0023AFE827|nr:hypothetical protein [Vibrio sp. DW001]WED29883.1 hypothetical protein L3V77_20980 [Vibrio sp. DW001]
MDTTDVIIDYSAADFADAIRLLLPRGDYWQEADNQALTNTIEGMAIDFKATHDDIELSLLTNFEARLFGWKISDYQALLFSKAGKESGQVYDSAHTPNLIYVSLKDGARNNARQAWTAFEQKRLPHTEITWIYNSEMAHYHQIANARHIRNLHQYEVTQ